MARTTCCWALGRRLRRSSWRWSFGVGPRLPAREPVLASATPRSASVDTAKSAASFGTSATGRRSRPTS
jgi:hypothetical protein